MAKVVYNMFADIKLPLDKWTTIDIVNALCNIVCFNVTGSMTPDTIIVKTRKQNIDFYVIAVVILSWFRFFSFFLIIKTISKLLMTLIQMIRDTLSFIFIVFCFLLISASIFTTIF
jgi:hypothetical protein